MSRSGERIAAHYSDFPRAPESPQYLRFLRFQVLSAAELSIKCTLETAALYLLFVRGDAEWCLRHTVTMPEGLKPIFMGASSICLD